MNSATLRLLGAITFAAVARVLPADASEPTASVNVVDYGAKGDGSVDDSDAVLRAIKALPRTGGVVFFPAGAYLLSKPIPTNARPAIVFRGAGVKVSTLTSDFPGLCIAADFGPERAASATFEDLCFKLSGNSAVALRGDRVASAELRRCRFWNGYGISLDAMSNVTINGCSFESSGQARYSCVTIKGACRNVQIRQNRFTYFKNAIMAVPDAKGRAAEDVVIEKNFFDGAWWLRPADFTGSGSTLRYTSDSVTDPGAHFTNLEPGTTVRIMPELEKGVGTATGVMFRDPTAHFRAAGIRAGQIVRCGDAFAVVAGVDDDNTLRVEEWLSDRDRQPVSPPAGEYTVFGVCLGKLTRSTSTTLSVVRWHDFDGNTATPPAGARYEVAAAKPNYPVHFVRETKRISVDGNVFLRGWSDQISIYGSECVVMGNTVRHGQDMGITIQDGARNRVVKNVVTHQGTAAISLLHTTDNVITDNSCADSMWVSLPSDPAIYGDVVVYESSRNKLANNTVERLSCSHDRHGIVIYSSRSNLPSASNEVRDNVAKNHTGAEFLAAGPQTIGTIFAGNSSPPRFETPARHDSD